MKIRLLLAGLVLLPVLMFWYLVVHQDEGILALVRSDVALKVCLRMKPSCDA